MGRNANLLSPYMYGGSGGGGKRGGGERNGNATKNQILEYRKKESQKEARAEAPRNKKQRAKAQGEQKRKKEEKERSKTQHEENQQRAKNRYITTPITTYHHIKHASATSHENQINSYMYKHWIQNIPVNIGDAPKVG